MAVAGSGVLDDARTTAATQAAGEIRKLVLDDGVRAGHLTKWLGTDAVDGSLPACVVPFGLVDVDDPIAGTTLDAVGRALDVGGGVHRFRADVFYGGGQWLLLSALLGWNRAVAGDTDAAWRHLRWIASHATAAGELPEQVPDHLLAPEHQAEWIDRWGPVATPLLWSHGMYLIHADELGLLTCHLNTERGRGGDGAGDRGRRGTRASAASAVRCPASIRCVAGPTATSAARGGAASPARRRRRGPGDGRDLRVGGEWRAGDDDHAGAGRSGRGGRRCARRR